MPLRFACLPVLAVLAAGAAVADDSARISRLETEIQQLRALVDEQARRIQRLEDEMKRRAAAPAPQPRPRLGDMRTDAPAPAVRRPWHGSAPWERVTKGMSEADVVGILGEPTSADAIGTLKTLFYRGAVPGGGQLSGHVNLKEGRVVAVSKPAF
jgi:hypothetical protein